MRGAEVIAVGLLGIRARPPVGIDKGNRHLHQLTAVGDFGERLIWLIQDRLNGGGMSKAGAIDLIPDLVVLGNSVAE